MFSSSIRRAALGAPPPPITSTLTSSIPRAATQTVSSRRHQRRASSSKPSSPANGSKKIPDDGAVASAATKPAGTKASKEGTSTGRKRGSSAKYDPFAHLPSVPSTQHIPEHQIGASAFFAMYRPISLTHGFPRPVTDEAFAAIFTPRTKSNRSTEVIDTLSTTLRMINDDTGRMETFKLSGRDQWNENNGSSTNAEAYQKEVDHLDGVPADSSLPYLLSQKHQPFNPPPAPRPLDTPESLAAGVEVAEAHQPQHRTYTTVVTIKETTDAFGDVTYLAHHSPLVAEDPPRSQKFRERMQIRQEQYRINQPEKTDMLAISVKRQRKLKMKKHKYKKLMKKTRNLRRRLDRI